MGTPKKEYTKPRKIRQSPDRLYKAPTDYTKPQKDCTKTQIIRQRLEIFNTNLEYLTRVATNVTYEISSIIIKKAYINQIGMTIHEKLLNRALWGIKLP